MGSTSRSPWMIWFTCVFALVPALIGATDSSKTVWNTETLVLECNTSDLDNPLLEWEVNGTSFTPTGARIKQAENGTLTISNAVKKDSGVYKCIATSGADVADITYQVLVKHFKVLDFPTSVNLVEGNTLELECEVETDNEDDVTITWYKGEDVVSSGGRVSISDDDELEGAKLTIQKTVFDDRAEYKCVASLEEISRSSSRVLVRIKDHLAPLWPFLGICANLAVVAIISILWDRSHKKKVARGEHDSSDTPPPRRASHARHH